MNFISQQQAEEIREWEKKNPEKAKEFNKLHRKWADKFINGEMSYDEFRKLHEDWRKKNRT